jgi:ABC-2 type transport system ATP-binding protein
VSNFCVDVHDLTKKFGDFAAVDGVSFQIPYGSIFGFLGPNGAGKSTTIRMLLGILPISSGSGKVLGLDIRTQSQQIRSRVGYMSQKFSLYEDLTVVENLNFFASVQGLPPTLASARREHLLKLCRLEDYQEQLAFHLPGGIRQRLAFAVALLHDPDIIFLDEPPGAVDQALRRYFWDIIEQLSRSGKTVMVTTHYIDEVERCDQICFIAAGRLIAQGSPGQIKAKALPGQMYHFVPKKRQESLDFLGSQGWMAAPFPSGNRIRFLVPNGGAVKDSQWQLVRDLAQGPVEATEATLEDVFIALQRQDA